MQKSFGGKDPGVTRAGGGRLADDVVDEEGDEDAVEGDEEDEDEGEEEWDIDADPLDSLDSRDSGIGASEDGSVAPSPLRRMGSSTVD